MKRRKGLAFILALSLVLSSFSVAFATDVAEETTPVTETTTEAVAPVATATNTAFADIAGHWAKDAIIKWADYGVVKGSDGVFRPDAPLTRAEMATILSNLMDYKVAAKNNFSDVATGAWYADAVLKANAAGVLRGDGSGLASPSANITREQATSMLARAFAVADANGTSSSLTDTQNISSWARPAVFGMEAAGYVRGFEGKFNPKNNITRAEVMTIINSAVKAYYTAAGTYTENVDGLAVVKVPGVVLKDVVISGNLIAAEGIASGDLTLDGKTEVKGKLIVRGGGENSIIIKGSAAVLSIEVSKVDGKVRIFADVALVKEITALKGEIILEGNFTNVEVKADATVIIKGNVGTLSMESKGTVDIQSGTVTTLDIPAGATATIAANATVTTANITGAADIKGTGAIGTANISGTGATIVQTPTAVNIADGGAATVGGKTVDGATSAAPSTGGGSGGGGNSSNTVAVSAININKSTTTLVEGTTETLTVTFTPSNASNKTITWTTSDASKATIDSTGKVRAVSAGTATITAKSNNGKTATCVVTVTTTVVSVSAITVTGDGPVVNGKTLQMGVDITPTTATNKKVTWSVINGTGSATINSSGLLTATGVGTVTVKALAQDGSGKDDIKIITITPSDAELLAQAKINKKALADDLLTGLTQADYTTASWTTLIDAIAADKSAIDAKPTVSEVTGYSLTATAAKAALVTLADELAQAKLDAKADLLLAFEAYSADDYTDDHNIALGYYKDEGNIAIDAATDLAEVASALGTAISNMAGVTTIEQTLATAKADLDLGYVTEIVSDMTLPTIQNGATVSWSSSDVAVIANDGTVTRPAYGKADATVTLTATITLKAKSVTKAFEVTVKAKAATQYTLTLTGDNISSTPGAGKIDENTEVKVTIAPATGKQVATFTVGGVDKKAELVENVYTFNITADTTVAVTYKDIKVTEVTLDKTTLNLTAGGATETLTATVNPSDALNKAVTWTSSDEAVATVADGVVAPLAAGTTTITVKTVDGDKTATCTVTVTAAPVPVADVTLDKTTLNLTAGGAPVTLVATVNPSEATNKDVTWSSSNPTVATVAGGVVTPKAAGTATITVTTVDGSKTATCKVTVTAAPVLGTLYPTVTAGNDKVVLSAMTADEGYKFYYKHTAGTDVVNKPALDSTNLAGWTEFTTNTDITGANGTPIFVQVIKVATDGGKIKAWGEASATPAYVPVTGVTLSQTTMSLKVGTGTGTLTATIAPANATNKNVTWTSSVPTIATVDSNGKVTPVAVGETTITVKTTDGNYEATCTVTVTAANVATAVFVNGGKELKGDKPYLVNGEPAETGTLGSGGCTAHFKEGILTLHGYNGGEIKNSFADKPDLIIKLIGTNTVAGTQTGISNDDNGDIYITADNDATLTVNTVSADNFSYAISSKSDAGGSAGSVVIGGKANVVVSAISTGTGYVNQAHGIFAHEDVTIQENAHYSATIATHDVADGSGIFAKGKITINTTGNIDINCTNSKGSVALYPGSSLDIINVKLMTLKARSNSGLGEGFIYKSPVLPGVAVNIAGKVASYRSGTPYVLEVLDGDITGVTAGVIVQAGQPYQALANDTITIKSKTIPLFEFVKWTNQDGTALDSSLFVSPTAANSSEAKIKMPAKDLNIKAEYKSTLFTTQPSFHRGAAKVTWEISQAASDGYLQMKDESNNWVNRGYPSVISADASKGFIVVSDNPGVHTTYTPDGTYRLYFKVAGKDHYSEEFVVEWEDTITIQEIPGVTPPVTGATPVTTITATDQYTGTVTWSPTATKFAGDTAYTATITLKAKSGYKLDGVTANFFTVAGATASNAADSGVITAVFPKTALASTDASLSDLTVDGTTISGFYASTLIYNVELVIGTTTVPTVGATANDSEATIAITQASTVTGSAKIVVTAEDGTTTKTYKINFTVVEDTTPPVITATDKIVPIADLEGWTETVSANDNVDGDITSKIVKTYFKSDGTTSLTDLAAAKAYIGDATTNTSFVIKYNVSDAAGNPATEVVVTITVTKANIPDKIFVNNKELNSTSPYLVGNEPKAEGSLGVDGCTAHFDPMTGVLSLQGYSGGGIRINEADKDLSIKLIGNANKITCGQSGIYNYSGDIHIMSDNEASLEIDQTAPGAGAAIVTGWQGFGTGSVIISGKANVKATSQSTSGYINGIQARKDVIIQDEASFDATLKATGDRAWGIYAANIIINTIGDININFSDSGNGVGIYSNAGIDIQQVNSMLITIPSTGGTNTKFTSGTVDVLSGVAVNKSTTVASYRSGTPYTLGLEGGNITTATGGVIGSPHQYLEDDEITIESTISEFDRWTKANGGALETLLFINSTNAESTTATIKMPAANLSIKAREKETGTVINIAAIPGVTAPVTGATPVTKITDTDQYTGTVTWSPKATKFAGGTVYTATITLKAKPEFKLDSVAANFFTVAGATTVTNEADTGEITAVFPATEADTLINIAAIPGVVAPVTGATPVTTSINTTQYTGTVAWTPADNPFAAEKVYKATIKLTAKTGFTLDGVIANFFTVNGIATTHVAGVVTVEFPATAAFGFAGGDGSKDSPYQVSNAEQLNKVREYMGSGIYFKQTANIDLSDYLDLGGAGYNEGKGWVPIGSSESSPFKGTYDGSGYTITGLTIVSTEDYQGLFGYGGQHTNLKNINLLEVNIKGKSFVGGLIGYFGFGQLENCHVSGKVEGTGNFVGGLAGIYNNSNVGEGMKNCSTSVEVIGINYVGGLAGKSGWTTIDSCYSSGSVTGVDIVGGLVGNVASELNVKVTNSYSLASVKATGINGRVGGLVGLNQKAIENCYAAGQVTGNGTNAGGLVGENKGTITSSYYDSTINTQSEEGKGVGKTTVDMMKKTTFEGWDFTNIWTIVEGSSYPTLK